MSGPEEIRLDVGALVPEEYTRYRELIADAFRFFVRRIRSGSSADGVPSSLADVAGRVVDVMRRSPVLHKLGQVVARDRRLSVELRAQLQELESVRGGMVAGEVRRLIEDDLGGIGRDVVFDERDATRGLLEGSVAVVVPFQWEGREGVFKVLKPGIEEKLGEELDILSELGVYLDERCDGYGLPPVDYAETFQSVRDLLSSEVRLDVEQKNLREAANCYEGWDRVRVPEVYPMCSRRVTAMERLDGCKVTEADGDRSVLARVIVEALIGRPMWSADAASLFHADPHAGNLMALHDSALGILDWSLTGRLRTADRECVVQALLGGWTLDAGRVCRAVAGLTEGSVDDSAVRAAVGDSLRRVRGGMMPGMAWLVALMDGVAGSGGVRFGTDLLMFRKSLLTLEGVLSDVSEDCWVDGVLARAGMEQLGREWPMRMTSTPFAPRFGTHVSTADLWSLMWSGPATAARYWSGRLGIDD